MRTVIILSCLAILLTVSTCHAAERKPLTPTPTFRWKDWGIELSPDGNIQHLFLSYDEGEELKVLTRLAKDYEEKRRKEHGIEPNEWRVLYCLSKETDMIFRDVDGTRYRETAGMGRGDLEWALLNEQQFYDAAYAYSRGNVKIVPTDRVMEEPMLGEYTNVCFFWARGWPDLGIGLDSHDYDSVVGHYYPGETRPWARGGTGGGGGWCDHLGHTSVQFAPGREVGGSLGDLGKITLHEWLHQIDGQKGWKTGYVGLPGQYSPGNYHHGSHLFWMWYMLPSRMFQTMRMQAPLSSPPNKPQDRYDGFIQQWLVLGEYDLPRDLTATEAGIPHPKSLEFDSIDVKNVMPLNEKEEEEGKKWKELGAGWDKNNISLRRAFPSPHKNAYAYAHVYVHSPDRRDAILWIGGHEPGVAYLNGHRVLTVWRGATQDEASRRVVLMKGWNRLLVKKLDQEDKSWNLFARFTDTKHIVLDGLKFSSDKPESEIIATAAAKPAPPIEVKHYKWEWPVTNDWFGSLPVLNEEHLEKILGVKGVRILGAPGTLNGRGLDWKERRYTLIDVSAVDKPEKILSRKVPWAAEKATLENDSVLNNVLNMSRETGGYRRSFESMALIRYRKDNGSTGDLVFVRADMIEPFMDIAKVPDDKPDWKHSERIVGFICRDSKTFVVFDTDLGKQMPINELDMLTSKDGNIEIVAAPSIPRVLRGREVSVNFRIRNIGKRAVTPSLTVREFAADKPPVEAALGTIAPGDSIEYSMPVDTKRPAGLVTFFGKVDYKLNGKEYTVEKPVPINLFDAITINIRVDGSEILMVPDQKLIVKVSNNLDEPASGTLTPTLPKGYTVEPASVDFELQKLDETKTFNFDVKVGIVAEEGLTDLVFEAKIDKRGALTSRGSLPVSKAFGKDLVFVDFEEGITGDFAFTNAHYFVKLSKLGAKFGKQCLEIFDRGGARYGHVTAFGQGPHHPATPYLPDTQYVYDTRIYPYVDFWFKTEAKNDNLGIHIILDDGENGYGFLLNGFWVQQWVPRTMIGKVDFEPNGEWQHIVINVDDALDKVLGDTSHFVRQILIGDTRGFASGWWYYFDSHRHYIDDFRITKGPGPTAKEHKLVSDSGIRMFDRANRVPAFNTVTVKDLKATCQLTKLGYFPWENPRIKMWATNTGDETISLATHNITRLWEINITTADGKAVTDGWISHFWTPELQDHESSKRPPRDLGIPHAEGHFRELKPGESWAQQGNIQDFFGNWASVTKKKLEPEKEHREAWKEYLEPGREYIVKLRYRSEFAGEKFGHSAWTGTVETNPVYLTIIAMPSIQEELEALNTSLDAVRRAKACAQLGKGKYEPAIPALCRAALEDEDGDVRLNAVWALGEYGKYDPAKPETAEKIKANSEALIKALDDENWRVGEYAASSLGRLRAMSATPHLLKRLDNKSKWIRRRTAVALHDMADPKSVDKLGELMHDRSREVRLEVQKALIRIVHNASQPLMHKSNILRGIPENDERRAAERENLQAEIAELRAPFDKAFNLANVAKDDEYWEMRTRWIAELPKLSRFADVRPAIIAALKDENERVRHVAIRAVGQFAKSLNITANDKRNPEEAEKAAALLEEVRTEATPIVIQSLGDYYDFVRRAAVENLPSITPGKGALEHTGKDKIYWFRKYPRPGDDRYKRRARPRILSELRESGGARPGDTATSLSEKR